MRQFRSLSFGLAALLATLPVLSGGAVWAEDAASAPKDVTLPAITVSAARMVHLRDRVVASGLVAPVETVLVQPLIEGQPIETLNADVGDTVSAGQVLAKLSDSTLLLQESQFEASLATAQAQVAQAEAQLLEAKAKADDAKRINERTAALRAQGSASQAAADTASANAVAAQAGVTVAVQMLEAAKAQVKVVQAQIENLDLELTRTEVVAPVGGTVVERNAMVGAIASAAGDPMFTLVRDGELELRADVAERLVAKLQPGQPATLRAVGLSEPLSGTIRLVDPVIDTGTRLGRARITVDRNDAVRQGMFMDADILVAERDTLAIPVTAVGAAASGATVMKVTDGVVSRVPVQLGIREDGLVEVVSGLNEGDLVVTKAASFVRDGDHIKPVPETVGTN
ncbi:efflux RND transporter periplasmic adaptor subunit [Tabrizicola sp. J26]|uniref:efflux RND transporter periplasmic adaptor subunit n=1 Tax=Alitabrizicola rongguiensis TaxID=2909234 RepID=UPI001F3E2390|nr:efflux RND transporter periplasmic adaptor subunit [Tabrizicola rongguiensis]MCF1707503.1 efflux RND transporter periplasmic adaptor subunit [Tabrizicola rongguiensis]